VSKQIRLPQTPNVVVREKCVVICYVDGSETVWGEEKHLMDAWRVARELEIELRAINYIKWHVRRFIREMMELLFSIDADEKLLMRILIYLCFHPLE